MDDAGFDLWLNALEKTEGCKENAVRAYVEELRGEERRAEIFSKCLDDVRGILVDLSPEPTLMKDTRRLAQEYVDALTVAGKERDALHAALLALVTKAEKLDNHGMYRAVDREDIDAAQALLDKLSTERQPTLQEPAARGPHPLQPPEGRGPHARRAGAPQRVQAAQADRRRQEEGGPTVSDKDESLEGCGLGIVMLVAVMPVGILVRAFVLTKVWAWYVVDALGMAPIGMLTAFGISLLTALARGDWVAVKKKDEQPATSLWKIGVSLGLIVCGNGLILLLGWLGTLLA